MGMCWSSGRDMHQQQYPSLPRNPEARREILRIDESNSFLQSYAFTQKNVFQKKVYNWKSIPIITQFDFKSKASFEIKNRGIKDNNFVVGIIKKSAINLQISLPWKTHYCICYESHQEEGESGVVFDGKIDRKGKGIAKDETIRVIVSSEGIQFKSNKILLAKQKMPPNFLNDEILPYIALFNKGDRIQILNQVQLVKKKSNKE